MSAEYCRSLPASLAAEHYRTSEYFILIKDGVARTESRLTGTVANKGDIFQHDPDSDGSFHEIIKADKKKKTTKPRKVIMRAVNAKKVKVTWDSASFAPLTKEEKELLEAIDSPKCRFMIYSDAAEYLSFGCDLKEGDMVQVHSSALPKSKDDVHGILMHKGPLFSSKGFDPKGTWFGVVLSTSCGTDSGRYKGHTYFDCDPENAVFVSIDKLVPPVHTTRKREVPREKAKDIKPKNRPSTDLGLEGVAKPTFFDKGDKVEVATFSKNSRRHWIEGEVVDTKTKDGETFVAVEVEKHHQLAINTNGFYQAKMIFSRNMSAWTVTARISDVRHLELTQSGDLKQEGGGATEGPGSNPSEDMWHKKESIKEQQAAHGRETSASSSTSRGNMKYPKNKVEKPIQPTRKEATPQVKIGNILENTQMEMQNNLSKNSGTSPVITRPPVKQEMNFYDNHFDTESSAECVPSHQSSRNEEGKIKERHSEPKKGIFSTIAASLSFKGVEQPPFPLDNWCLGQISIGGEDLLRNLAYDLQIREPNEIFRRGKDCFQITSHLLKHWWEQLNEGHRAALKDLKDSLKKHGFGELVYYMEKGEPTDGEFDPSIKEIVVHRFGKRLPSLADKLGVPITADKLPLTVLGDQIFDIWQKRHPGTEKLSQLVRVIKEISREITETEEKERESDTGKAAELRDLALDLEQGLSENVVRSISSSVPKDEWYQLGYSLGLTQLRLNAMERKFFLLRDRVFHVLRYWQMTQPYEVDQAEKLIVALQSCGLQENIHMISKGLDEERLLKVAECIGCDWKIFAGIVFDPTGIHHLIERTARDQDNALLALRKWKRKQPAECKDLKNKLYNDLKKFKLPRAAKVVFDGLDTDTLYSLARKVVFDCQPLAKSLNYANYEIQRFEIPGYPEQSSFQMLATWNDTNARDLVRKEKLCDAIQQIGLEHVAEWLKNGDEDIMHDDVDKQQENTTSKTSKHPEHEFQRIDQMLLREIATKLKGCDADIAILKEFLELSVEDTTKFAPKNIQYSSDPYLYNLMVWRKKMRHLDKGTQEIGSILQDALNKCGLEDAAKSISVGTPVDGQGAVGGFPTAQSHIPKENLHVNSLVEFIWNGKLHNGTILWIDELPEFKDHGKIAGIETEEHLDIGGNYEFFRGRKYFECEHGRGIFLPLTRCMPDSRFPTESETLSDYTKTSKEDFGGIDCDPIPGYEKPQQSVSQELIGQYKGIQGDHNSCYMDVTLYSMFAYSDIFDRILGWPKESKDDGVQFIKDHLRESIVNPLRRKGVVRADYILHFREMLNELSSMKGLRTEEKDPEEFIHTLLQELLNAKPFLKISQGDADTMESFVYQIFLERKDYLEVPTVEQLVHLSFLESNLKLVEVPECFIVQLPRFGKQFKLYDWIIPSLEMDITPIVKNSTRPCTICGMLAFQECKDCRPKRKSDEDIIQSFCTDCWKLKHEKLSHHTPVTLSCKEAFMKKYLERTRYENDPATVQDIYDSHKMELFSVMCIETSHYVAFVKTGSEQESQWVFFDSMADRIGDHRGFNVPEVSHIPSFEKTVNSPDLINQLKMPTFPSYMKRLFGDAYICFYRQVVAPHGASHGRGGDFQRHLNEASQHSQQKTLYREQSHLSRATSSDTSISDSLKSEDLMKIPVHTPPRTGDKEQYEATTTAENPTLKDEEAMEVDLYGETSERWPPNIVARSRRWEFSDTGISDYMNRVDQTSHHTTTYTSSYTYNISPNAQFESNIGLHGTNPACIGSRQTSSYRDESEEWQV